MILPPHLLLPIAFPQVMLGKEERGGRGEREREKGKIRGEEKETINKWVWLSHVSALITWVVPSECHHFTVC